MYLSNTHTEFKIRLENVWINVTQHEKTELMHTKYTYSYYSMYHMCMCVFSIMCIFLFHFKNRHNVTYSSPMKGGTDPLFSLSFNLFTGGGWHYKETNNYAQNTVQIQGPALELQSGVV